MLGFAQNVRKNLNFIMKERSEGKDVHEVTQLVISLLGLIVFTREYEPLKNVESLPLETLEQDGWPHWEIVMDEKRDTTSLRKLNWHLRNAVSHRRIEFSSDDRDMNNVQIEFKDALPQRGAKPNWHAKIFAGDLKQFCDRFLNELEEAVG